MLTRLELHAYARDLLGGASNNEVAATTLDNFINAAAEEVARLLRYVKETDSSTITLVADTYEYSLPSDFEQLTWAQWNSQKLEYKAVEEWQRDGINWRDTTSAQPREIAIDGRTAILYPPPSSTAIATASVVVLRYTTPGITIQTAGLTGMRDADARLVVRKAVIDYCTAYPSEANLARGRSLAPGYQEQIRTAMILANNQNPNYQPRLVLAPRPNNYPR